MSKSEFKERARAILDPVVGALASLGVSPFLVSTFGAAFSIYAGYVIGRGSLFGGAIWLLLSGLADMIDGALARRTNTVSRFGAFFDSTIDRLSEIAVFTGLIVYYVDHGYGSATILLISIVLGSSLLISYARARLEGLGYTCYVGLMEKPERITLLIVGLLLGRRVLLFMLFVLALGSVYTVYQRIRHGYEVTREDPGPPGGLPKTEGDRPHDETPPPPDDLASTD